MAIDLEPSLRRQKPSSSTDRHFGLVMAAFFTLLTALQAWHRRGLPSPHWPALALAFACLAALAPSLLKPLNRAWTLLGRLLHKIMSPVILGLLYYLFFTPFSWVFRLAKPDPLQLMLDKKLPTYWIPRASQPSDSLKDQF